MTNASLSATLFAAVLALGGCGADSPAGTALAAQVIEEVREDIATDVFTLTTLEGVANARLTPEGDLVIDGTTVAMDAAQRRAALAYRAEVARVAETGALLGLQGAGFAKEAVGAALAGLAGAGDAGEARIEAAAGELEVQALALCDSLVTLIAAQKVFADAVPEFAPYARIAQADIDECRADV